MTTSRAESATSNTTLAASPAGIQGASSPPLHERPPEPKKQSYRGHEGSQKIAEAGRHSGPRGAPARGFAGAAHVSARGSREKIVCGVVAQISYSQEIT